MESFPLATSNREDGIKSRRKLDLKFGLVQPQISLFMELSCSSHILPPEKEGSIPCFHP